jgi:hypothetical protein
VSVACSPVTAQLAGSRPWAVHQCMGASVEIVLLTTVAAVAVIYAFYLRVLRDRAVRRLLDWLRTARGDEWAGVQRSARWFNPVGAVERLRRGSLSDDEEFAARYDDVKSHDPRFLLALAIGLLAIAVLAIGTRTSGWSY